MEKFLGTFGLVESENFEELLKAKGINLIAREAMKHLKPDKVITDNGDGSYTILNKTIKNITWTFKLGEEFVGDGGPIEGSHTMKFYLKDDGTLVECHKRQGKDWEEAFMTIDGDNLILDISEGSVKAKRVFKRK